MSSRDPSDGSSPLKKTATSTRGSDTSDPLAPKSGVGRSSSKPKSLAGLGDARSSLSRGSSGSITIRSPSGSLHSVQTGPRLDINTFRASLNPDTSPNSSPSKAYDSTTVSARHSFATGSLFARNDDEFSYDDTRSDVPFATAVAADAAGYPLPTGSTNAHPCSDLATVRNLTLIDPNLQTIHLQRRTSRPRKKTLPWLCRNISRGADYL